MSWAVVNVSIDQYAFGIRARPGMAGRKLQLSAELAAALPATRIGE